MIVVLNFDLNEDVTPSIFADKVAHACAKFGAMRIGESVYEPLSSRKFKIQNEGNEDDGVCWYCNGTKFVDEPICGYCEEGVEHSHCDDTWYKQIPCPDCNQEK